jgi:hypothetical protein
MEDFTRIAYDFGVELKSARYPARAVAELFSETLNQLGEKGEILQLIMRNSDISPISAEQLGKEDAELN